MYTRDGAKDLTMLAVRGTLEHWAVRRSQTSASQQLETCSASCGGLVVLELAADARLHKHTHGKRRLLIIEDNIFTRCRTRFSPESSLAVAAQLEVSEPQHVSHIEHNHNRQRDVCGEKVGGIKVEKHTVTVGDGDDNKEARAEVGPSFLQWRSEHDLVVEAVVRNGLSEVEVGERHENPRDEAGNRADVGEPGEHFGGRVGAVEEREQGDGSCESDRVDWHAVSGAAGEDSRHLSVAGQRVQASGSGEKLRVTARVRRREDGGVDDVVEHLDSGVLDADHVRRAGGTAGSRVDGVHEPWVVRANDNADHNHADDVEEGESVDEPLAGLWQVRPWGLGLGGTRGDQLRAENESKRALDDSCPAREELAGVAGSKVLNKGAWVFPVVETEHAVRGRRSAEENDDSHDNQADDGDDLDGRDPELDLAEELHRTEVEHHARDPEDRDEDGHVGVGPVLDHKSSGGHF
ncbi:hypothetical protein KL911_002419 [Ogataea haglerorum]|uniref:uncharacterized protein n=1 Tax=Ogataea haglerorum TaxID=1937702 RepID=UPI001C89A464|nr:uncharacterized protein KL911_002419 [Ogataea haglerorum]KAG7753943.1 hypothetical protein KL911_002419 [Ogataea haglerorum]KAG7802153.1 hypothetical protein KL944_002530 [Ogataea haglerorum]